MAEVFYHRGGEKQGELLAAGRALIDAAQA
jgi:hypothetical protein